MAPERDAEAPYDPQAPEEFRADIDGPEELPQEIVSWQPVRHGHVQAHGVSTLALAAGTVAVGALAVGALAIGALAIGRMAVGTIAVKRARIDALEVGELTVGRIRLSKKAR